MKGQLANWLGAVVTGVGIVLLLVGCNGNERQGPTPQSEIDANHEYGANILDAETTAMVKEFGGTGYTGYWDNKTGQFHRAPGYDGPIPEQPPPLPDIE
jgi:hypothetical protein